MVKRGRIPSRERQAAEDRILHALETHSDGLGVRELRREMRGGSFQTICKYLNGLLKEKKVVFRESSVGRGRPKKIFTLSRKGIAHLLEFRILEYFEKVRESCMENERFEIDNYAFSYAIYGMPRNLDQNDKEQAESILKRMNSALLELDDLRQTVANREACEYRRKMTKVHAKIFQYVSRQNKDRKPVVIDAELRKELDKYIPSSVKDKMKLNEKENFALIITRGPSFIDEYALRPENYLSDLFQAVESWDDDGIDSIIRQLARNQYVDAEVIDRLKQWDTEGRISGFYWQQIKNRLDDIPEIRKEMKKGKVQFIESGKFKKALGLREGTCFVVTKEMLGKRKLDKLRKELSELSII